MGDPKLTKEYEHFLWKCLMAIVCMLIFLVEAKDWDEFFRATYGLTLFMLIWVGLSKLKGRLL